MKKNVTIDRLRGFSVLVVVCMHYCFFFPSVLTFLHSAVGNGYYGVTAFFCTSGFLITTSLLKRYDEVAKVNLYAFYVRRFARIVPPLTLLCLALAWLSTTTIPSFVFQAPITLKDTLLNIVQLRYNHYYQRVGAPMKVWAILWSLTIEEVFYLAYPLMAKVTRRAWLLAVILGGVVLYAIVHRRGGLLTIFDYFGCFDGIALGALSALAAQRFAARMNHLAAWALMLAGVSTLLGTYAALDVRAAFQLGLPLIALGAALVLFASQCSPFVETRLTPYDPFAYLGRISYEMYLFHMMVLGLLASVVTPTYPWVVFTVFALCLVTLSAAVARLYAEPLNRRLQTLLLPVRKPLPVEAGLRTTV